MENCLVTTLKSEIQNDNLRKITEVGLSFEENGYLGILSTIGITIRANANILSVEGSGNAPSNSLEIPSGSFESIIVSGTGKVFLPYASISRLWSTGVCNFEGTLEGMSLLYDMNVSNSKGVVNFGFIPNSIRSFTVSSSALYNFKGTYSVLTTLNLGVDASVRDITLQDLVTHCPNIHIFTASGFENETTAILGNLPLTSSVGPQVSGSLEQYVASQRAKGRTEGSTSFKWFGDGHNTFNGVEIVSGGTAKTLSWTATTITFDGTTIEA